MTRQAVRTLAVLGLAAWAGRGATPPPASGPPGPQAASASVPTAAFAPDGSLWLVWVDGRQIYVGSSRDLGRSFSTVERVNATPESIDANGEARPKLAVGPNGEVYVSYTRKGEKPFTGDIRFSRRLPDASFSEPVIVNDDGLVTGHRFDTLAVAPSGRVQLFWIDKRDLELAKRNGQEYDGAALYQAESRDGGRSFSANRKLKDHICECCRLAVALDGDVPVVLWRDLLAGGVRDHSLARIEDGRAPGVTRATDDGWMMNGCPHHGPAIAVGPGGTQHLAWFTGAGKRGSGTFYRRSTDQGRSFSEPVRLGTAGTGRPQVLATSSSVWVAWKAASAEGALVRGMRSSDGGLTWAPPRELASTAGESDHPQLLARGSDVFLSWFSKAEGYRLTAVTGP